MCVHELKCKSGWTNLNVVWVRALDLKQKNIILRHEVDDLKQKWLSTHDVREGGSA